MKDIDLLGSDIQFFNDIQTWEGCEDRCSDNPDCKSWTWVSTSYSLNTDIIFKCHLKNGFPSPSKVAGLISGYSKCKSKAKPGDKFAMSNTDLYGGDYNFTMKDTWEECASLCKAESECKSWTWVDTDYSDSSIHHKCHLKNAFRQPTSVTGLISGYSHVKQSYSCVFHDTDFYGSDIDSAFVDTMEDCMELCKANYKCDSFTWASEDFENSEIHHKCHLKSGTPAPSSGTGLISGYPYCKY